MNDIELRLFKIVLFLLFYAAASALLLKVLKRKFPDAKASDAEVIAVSAFLSAAVTGAVSCIVKNLF